MSKISEKLKQLKIQKDKLQAEHSVTKQEAQIINGRVKSLESQLTQIGSQMAALRTKEPTITDHAVVRLFERRLGYPVDKIKEELLKIILPYAQQFKSGRIPLGDGLMAVMEDMVIVTIEPKK